MRAFLAATLVALVAGWAATPALAKTVPPAVVAKTSQALTVYLDAEYEKELRMNPEQLTSQGRKDLYDKLTDRSDAAEARRLAWRRQSVATMKARFNP